MNNHEIAELVEGLRIWEDAFYSESETKLIMGKAADLIERLLREKVEEGT